MTRGELKKRLYNAIDKLDSALAHDRVHRTKKQMLESGFIESITESSEESGSLQQELFGRIKTFKASTWRLRDEKLNPLECSNKGWVNFEKNKLKCISCNSIVNCNFSTNKEEFSNEKEKFIIDKLYLELQNSHKTDCVWRTQQSPSKLYQPYFTTPRIQLKQIIAAAGIMLQNKLQIPLVKSPLSVPEVQNLITLIKRKTDLKGDPQERICYSTEPVNVERVKNSYQIAVFGWEPKVLGDKLIVTCYMCNRKAGLYLFMKINKDLVVSPDKTQEFGDNSELKDSTNTQKQSTNTFDLVREHRSFCYYSNPKTNQVMYKILSFLQSL